MNQARTLFLAAAGISTAIVLAVTGCWDAGAASLPRASLDGESPDANGQTERGPAADIGPGSPFPAGQTPVAQPLAGDEAGPGGLSQAGLDGLFREWPKPKAALLLTGRQHGYIEPCGCTGLANQKGGLARRHTLARLLRDRGWPLAALDVGNQVRRYGRQAEIKFQVTAKGLETIEYNAIAFGPDDLRLSTGELIAVTAHDPPDRPSRYTGANVALLDPALTPRFQVVEAGGLKIGVTAILGDAEQKELSNDELLLAPARDALTKVWPKLEAARCDLYVLLAQASLEESRALSRAFPQFRLVVTAGGAGEPELVPEKVGDAMLVQCGVKGMYAGVVGIMESGKLMYQRVPLDARFSDSQAMLDLLASYQNTLEGEGLEGLGLSPQPHPSGSKFVGSEKCGECHTKAFAIWKETPHHHATESLIHPNERSAIPRHFDPECLSCHVTGWNPQKYYPYVGGYWKVDQKLLHGNGCENCHGPGSRHVAAEEGELAVDPAGMKKLQESMRLPLDKARNRCLDCHDLDNDPDFQKPEAFEEYWEQIKHYGKD